MFIANSRQSRTFESVLTTRWQRTYLRSHLWFIAWSMWRPSDKVSRFRLNDLMNSQSTWHQLSPFDMINLKRGEVMGKKIASGDLGRFLMSDKPSAIPPTNTQSWCRSWKLQKRNCSSLARLSRDFVEFYELFRQIKSSSVNFPPARYLACDYDINFLDS